MDMEYGWSQWEEFNAPSAEDCSAALTLSYTGPEIATRYLSS